MHDIPAYNSLTEEEKLAFAHSHIFGLDAEAYQFFADKPISENTTGWFCQKARFLTYILNFYEDHGFDAGDPYSINVSLNRPQKLGYCFCLKDGTKLGDGPGIGDSLTPYLIHSGKLPFLKFKEMTAKALAHASWMPQVYREWQEHPAYAGMNDEEAVDFIEGKLSGITEEAYEAFCQSPLDEETTLGNLPWGMCQLQIAKKKWAYQNIPVCMASLMLDKNGKRVSLLDIPILFSMSDHNMTCGHEDELFRFMREGRICHRAFLRLAATCIRKYEGFVPSLLSFGWSPAPKQEMPDGRDTREA